MNFYNSHSQPHHAHIGSKWPYDARHTFHYPFVRWLVQLYMLQFQACTRSFPFYPLSRFMPKTGTLVRKQDNTIWHRAVQSQSFFHILSSSGAFVSCALPEGFSLLLTFIHVVGCFSSYSSYFRILEFTCFIPTETASQVKLKFQSMHSTEL